MITPLSNPFVVSEGVAQFSAHWSVEAWLASQQPSLHELLPPQLAKAVPKRQAEFVAGRLCAMEALRAAGCIDVVPPGIHADRSPVWPEGFVGSITHAEGFASAAVAPCSRVRGIGIDSERIMNEATAAETAAVIVSEAEQSILLESGPNGISRAQRVTLVFSAKESVYKCLYPLTGLPLDFLDLSLEEIDWDTRVIELGLRGRVEELRNANLPMRFAVRWECSSPLLHTGMDLSVSFA